MTDWIIPCATQPDNLSCGFYCYKDHNAYDLRSIFEEWWAARDGMVITVQRPSRANWGRTGWWVEIIHSDASISRYFHLSRIDVVVGQSVEQGQVCGITGNSGFTASGSQVGPHLHFAIHYPTYAAALAVWPDPRFTLGMWAVDPIYVIQHQEDEMQQVAVVQPNDGRPGRLLWSPDGGFRFIIPADLGVLWQMAALNKIGYGAVILNGADFDAAVKAATS